MIALRANGPYSAPTPAPNLASLIGYWPATINMLDWTGSDGKTLYGAYTNFLNLIPLSTSTAWSPDPSRGAGGGPSSVVAANIASYDGTTGTVQKLVEDASNNLHGIGYAELKRDDTPFHPIPYRLMVVAKAAERTRIVVGFTCPFSAAGSANSTASVGFDLAGGNTGYDVVSGTFITVSGEQMINLGNGFWACIFDFAFNGTAGTSQQGGAWFWAPAIYLDNGSGTAGRSTTYTGNGSSGAYICLCSMLPTALWNTRSRVYFNDFPNLNSIDLNNTKSAGFDFYTNNNFPNSSPTNFWGNPTPKPVALANVFSMYQPSIMQMQVPSYPGNTDNMNGSVFSVVDLGSGSGLARLQGNYWAAPAIFDGYMNFDSQAFGLDVNTYVNNTAYWSVAAETLAGSPLDGSGHYLEYDFDDTGAAPSGTTPLVWNNSPAIIGSAGVGPALQLDNKYLNLPTLRRLTAVWIDSTSGASGVAGWGFWAGFTDGRATQANFCYATYSTGGAIHPNGSATFATMDSQHLAMILWCSSLTSAGPFPAPAFLIDWVAVWQ